LYDELEDSINMQPEQLRRAMRLWATGVTIVTAKADGQQHGLTVSSFTSVSIDPPLVLVSIASTSRTGELIRQCGYFGVTILSEGQQDISDTFAGRVPENADRFAGLKTGTLISGAPFLTDSLAWLDCHLKTTLAVGMSMIYIGEVIAVQNADSGQPLIYFNRDYQDLCP
jgi:flavin reductase (DIM6/NTAB) family NADH-FMN oxidoreductase RutF